MTPQWHDTPPVPGLYVVRDAASGAPCGSGYSHVTDVKEAAKRFPGFRWYGPIPRDPKAERPE